MLVKDVMTKNVVTIPSDTAVSEAKKIMKEHKFRRLPVVDKGKLIGIVTEDRLDRVSHPATAPTLWQVAWLISKTTVADVMQKEVVTIGPEATVEQGVALAQSRGVGSLIVVENDSIVGIATTNDFFYRIVNPTLGIGESGTRIFVRKGGEGKAAQEIIACINRLGIGIKVIWAISSSKTKRKDIVIHLDTEDATQVIKDLQAIGYKANVDLR
jgi:acetoin utilization protein AcuB